jgi:integrase
MLKRIVASRRGQNLLGVLKLKSLLKNGKPGRHSDGNHLYLRISITKAGTKSCRWTCLYLWHGQEREDGLGSASLVSDVEARRKRDRILASLQEGIDPRLGSPGDAKTFEWCCEEWLRLHQGQWRDRTHKHYRNHLSLLCRSDNFGQRLVPSLTSEIIAVDLAPRPPGMRVMIQSTLRGLFEWCKVRGFFPKDRENPAIFKLSDFITQPKLQKTHRKSLPWEQLPEEVARIRALNTTHWHPLALLFIILTGCRGEEGRGARWEEINWDEKVWYLPKERMKENRPHSVPLAPQVMKILEDRKAVDWEQTPWVFPRRDGLNFISSDAVKKYTLPAYDVHGFRSSFASWAIDHGFPPHLIDLQLSHVVGGTVTRSYIRGTFPEQRRDMMEKYADYCLGVSAAS